MPKNIVPAAGEAMPTISTLFAEFEQHMAVGALEQDFDILSAIEGRIKKLQPVTAGDFAKKFLVITADGGFDPTDELMEEARRLAANEQAVAYPDPVIDAIAAYRQAVTAFNAIPDDVLTRDGLTGESSLVASTYGPHLRKLWDWTAPATSMVGAIEALRFGLEEAEQDAATPGTVHGMMLDALSYLEASEADQVTRCGDGQDDLEAVISAFVEALAAWYASKVDGVLPDEGPEPDAYNATAEAFIFFQCLTGADVQRKLQFVASCQEMKEEIEACGHFADFNASLILPARQRAEVGK